MSDTDNKYWYLESEKKPNLYFWIFSQMAMGAVYAAIVLFGAILFILVLVGISSILPEDPFALFDGAKTLTRLI